MNRETTIARTPLVTLRRFDHPPGIPHRDPREEIAPVFSLNVVERGTYDLTVARTRHRFTPGMIFATHPGLPYRCRHRQEEPDDVCLSLVYAEEPLREAGIPALLPVAIPPTNRLAYATLRLLGTTRGGAADRLDLESSAADLLAAAAAPGGRPARCYRPPQLAWYARRIDAARERLERSYAEPQSLGTLAREAGISPFHFARLFRELTGRPPHRYLTRVRLREAARRLREGATVTGACFESGFGNLSHFIRTFRRAFGVPPSRYRG
jgi:AraC-like DNA-binding protein